MLRKIILKSLIVLTLPLVYGFAEDTCPRFRPHLVSVLGVDKNLRWEVVEAIKTWNKLLGFNYFNINEYSPTLWIKTVKGAGSLCGKESVDIPIDISPSKVRAATIHALGHIIGLEHSYSTNNIMFPQIGLIKTGKPNESDIRLALKLIEDNIVKTK